MSSRRKIWSLPLALVTALLLVGLLGAVVLAQVVPDPAPEVGTDFVGQEITLQTGASGTENISPTQTTLADAFSDLDNQDPAQANTDLAYTALSTNPAVAEARLADDTTTIVTVWWDGLGARAAADGSADDPDTSCTKRQQALGSSVFVIDEDNAPANTETTTPPSGYCGDFAEVTSDSDADSSIIIQAFHWNMLTGPEMQAAAEAGGLGSPAGYKVPFSGLSREQRAAVENLYIDDDDTDGNKNVLSMGTGTFTIVNRGSDNTYDYDHDDNAATDELVVPFAGIAGTTSVTVKVSDGVGRFLENSVGQGFDVKTVPAELGPVSITDPVGTGETRTVEDGVGYRPLDVDGVPTEPDADIATYEFTISTDTTKIATVFVTGTTFASNHQKVNFSLTDGNNLPFQIRKLNTIPDGTDDDDEPDPVYDRAEMMVRPGATLTESSYEFDLKANELGNPAENSDSKSVKIVVAVDNTAPSFDSGLMEAATVAERASEYVIATFSASDPNNQALSFEIDRAASDAADQILNNLLLDASSGELKTSETGLDFEEDVADDPDTEDVDETFEGDNVHMVVITVSDGTLSASHTITITVTDEDEPERGEALNFAVDEDQAADVKIGSIELTGATGGYMINEQIDGTGSRKASEDSLFKIEDDSTDSSIGNIFLKAAGTLDYEDAAVSNNYTLSVSATGTSPNLVTIMVVDVNESPLFSDVDKARATVDGGAVKLYVLESASVGEIVKVGQDAGGNPATTDAQFDASDEDTRAGWTDIAYDLRYDDDDDAETDMVVYAGAAALVTVDSDGNIKVNTELDTDADDSVPSIDLVLRAFDPNDETLNDTLNITVTIIDTNVAPEFDEPSTLKTHGTVSEGDLVGTEVHRYRATDEDGDPVGYRLRDEDDAPFFTVNVEMVANPSTGVMEPIGVLVTNAGLDYEVSTQHTVEIQAFDTDGDTDEIVVTVDVGNANDSSPGFDSPARLSITVAENTARGFLLANYAATDADGDDVHYSLSGADAKSFMISDTGDLMTLESLDYDSQTPCSTAGCAVTVNASDMPGAASGAPVAGRHTGAATADVVIAVSPVEDSVSTLGVTKANPVPGTTMGEADDCPGQYKGVDKR